MDNENKVTYIDNDNRELGHEAVDTLQARFFQIGFICYLDNRTGTLSKEYQEAADNLRLDVLHRLVFSARTIETFKKRIGKIFGNFDY